MDFENSKIKTGLEDREKQMILLQRFLDSAKSIDGMNGRSVAEAFNPEDENSRRELISNLSEEKYCQLVAGVNGILRGKKKEEWDMDGVGVAVIGEEVKGGHIFLRHSDKKDIIAKAWQAAQRMNASNRDLEEIGMLLGSMLVETHPFMDGNGRTSRFIYQMVKDGFDKEKITAILGDKGRYELDMALTKKYINKIFEKKSGRLNKELNKNNIVNIVVDESEYSQAFGMLKFHEDVPKDIIDSIISAGRNDNDLLIDGLLNYSAKHPELDISKFTKEYPDGNTFLLQNFIDNISVEQLNELCETYWLVKKQYTEDMIDIFENPDKPEYLIKNKGKEMRMIDLFKQRIADKCVIY